MGVGIKSGGLGKIKLKGLLRAFLGIARGIDREGGKGNLEKGFSAFIFIVYGNERVGV